MAVDLRFILPTDIRSTISHLPHSEPEWDVDCTDEESDEKEGGKEVGTEALHRGVSSSEE
eukprot:3931096-Pyramimonas_sp.AAC.6